MYRFIISAGLAVLICVLPSSSSAHVLIKDRISNTGAIMHVSPDDDPVAGESSVIFFDIQNDSNDNQLVYSLQIINSRGDAVGLPIDVKGSTVTANYTFPALGLYVVRLRVTDVSGKVLYDFLVNQRLGRGVAVGSVNAGFSPLWAEAGVLISILGMVILGMFGLGRLSGIIRYSQK